MKHLAFAVTLAAGLCLVVPAAAQAQTASAPAMPGASSAMPGAPAGTTLAGSDVSFMKDAAQASYAEVEGSKVALDKASNTEVKAFAQQMMADHSKAGEELKTLAASKGVKLPEGPSMVQKGKLKLMSMSSGASFDKRYAQSVGVNAHMDAVKLFQKASTSAKDPDVKAFAANTLPALQHHLEMAQAMQASVSGSK